MQITPVLANLISHTLICPSGKIKIKSFMCLIYTGCIGCHSTPLLRLTSLNIMISLYVCNQSHGIIKIPLSEMKGMKEKESTIGVRDR